MTNWIMEKFNDGYVIFPEGYGTEKRAYPMFFEKDEEKANSLYSYLHGYVYGDYDSIPHCREVWRGYQNHMNKSFSV